MKEKILKYVIYAGGLLGLYVFLSVRILPMFNTLLIENRHPDFFEFTRYGELYYFSQIDHFKEDLPEPEYKFRLSDKNASFDEADIIAFGDSFFDFNRQKTVADRLQDSLGLKIHAVNEWFPLEYLNANSFRKGDKKVMIFEIVERNIHFRFSKPHTAPSVPPAKSSAGIGAIARNFKDKLFMDDSEELYSVLLKGSYISNSLYSLIATKKFDWFGYISSRTPSYDIQQFDYPVLFYDLTVNDNYTSFYFNHTDELISLYCDNLVGLERTLKSEYNIDLVFLPIPNKYTLYFQNIDPEAVYDNFLPRLYIEMEKRGITFVNVYEDFVNAQEPLFYGTDTHWNENGVGITVERILELFCGNNGLIDD